MFDDILITRVQLVDGKIKLVEYSNGQMHSGDTVFNRITSLGEELKFLIDGKIETMQLDNNGNITMPPIEKLEKINNL